MQLATATRSPIISATFTWGTGDHATVEHNTFTTGAPTPAFASFDGAIQAARGMVEAGTTRLPNGVLAPAQAVLATSDGFAVAPVLSPSGSNIAIDGEVVDGPGGWVLTGLDIRTTGAVAAIVGATSVIDLRDATGTSAWSRAGGSSGRWSRA